MNIEYKKYRVCVGWCDIKNKSVKKTVTKKEFLRLLSINEVIYFEGIGKKIAESGFLKDIEFGYNQL